MRQLGQGSCLAKQPLTALRPGGEPVRPEHLDRHPPVEVGVVRSVDDPRAAASEPREHDVATQPNGLCVAEHPVGDRRQRGLALDVHGDSVA